MDFVSVKILVIVLEASTLTLAYSINDTKDLLTELFTSNSYNKKVRPIKDQDKEVNVTITFQISAITQFDEQEESLTTAGYLSVEWVDEMLAWATADHNGISRLIVPQDDIWKPDISLRNSFSSFKGLGSSYFNAWIISNGDVQWEPFQIFKSTCSVDITFFPYDSQTCEMKFIAWSYSKNEVKFFLSSGIMKTDYSESATWEIAKMSSKASNEDTPTIIFTLKLNRKPLFYVLNMIVPVILLSFMNIFTFALPVKSGERASYAVTLFLSISVFLTIIASEFPKNSDNLSILALYLILMTSVSTIFVLVSVLQIRLVNRDEENMVIGTFYKLLLRLVNVLICNKCNGRKKKVDAIGESKDTDNSGIPDQSEAEAEVTWLDVVHAMDFLCFWIGSFVIFVVTLTIMLLLLNNPQRN
ncbi:neuronal acetylcholine receptor subunit alpha-5-like [Ruditapes philippinarum]|uniref:neuronal acetylcholine receptor subunit alpha-5-like n=1 Tax=Ruditapes philippinarum TaxID=129788 RepID=UPI00295B1AB9|nr:neuronal acetylcholine receptor subunit alpha-5-like [Ruditapes philippinarum]